jgi:hypothetical protein
VSQVRFLSGPPFSVFETVLSGAPERAGPTVTIGFVATTARIVYPVAVVGFLLAALLNAGTWLPVDVTGLESVIGLLFVGIFPLWLPVVVIFQLELRAYRASFPPRPWYRRTARLPWRVAFAGVPKWMQVVGGVVTAYVFINFFGTFGLLPRLPQPAGAASGSGMRLLTAHLMFFYGMAALFTYGRRRTPGSSPEAPPGDDGQPPAQWGQA